MAISKTSNKHNVHTPVWRWWWWLCSRFHTVWSQRIRWIWWWQIRCHTLRWCQFKGFIEYFQFFFSFTLTEPLFMIIIVIKAHCCSVIVSFVSFFLFWCLLSIPLFWFWDLLCAPSFVSGAFWEFGMSPSGDLASCTSPVLHPIKNTKVNQ